MGLLDKIKNFGSRIIKTIVKPRFDWHKLPKIDPSKLKPVGPGGIPKFNPTPGFKPINQLPLKQETIVKKQDGPQVKHGTGLIPMSKEDMGRMVNSAKAIIARGGFKK